MTKLGNRTVGEAVKAYGMGMAIDKMVEPQEIQDVELAILWADAQVKMNEIQLYLEKKLSAKFFNNRK